MAVNSILAVIIEKSLNLLIKHDNESKLRVAQLSAKTLYLNLTDINIQLVFSFNGSLKISTTFDGKADCYLAMPISIIPKLKDKENLTLLIKQGALELKGDLEIAQCFSNLINKLNPDLTEWLSLYTGDVLAHTLSRQAKQGLSCIKKTHSRQQNYIANLITEEWRITPSELELVYFSDKVEHLQQQVIALEMRLNTFEKNKRSD